MAEKKPEIGAIIEAAASHFEISVDELTDVKRQSPQHNQARLTALFVAAKAGYSNSDIAESMSYKSANTVSTKFNKAHSGYATPMDDSHMTFRRDCKAVARMVHVLLPE